MTAYEDKMKLGHPP